MKYILLILAESEWHPYTPHFEMPNMTRQDSYLCHGLTLKNSSPAYMEGWMDGQTEWIL